MKSNIILSIFLLFQLLAILNAKRSRGLANIDSAYTKDESCQPEERYSLCIIKEPVLGCLCKSPENCESTLVDRCRDCSNPEIYSVMAGRECPLPTKTDHHKDTRYICPIRAFHRCCTNEWYRGCLYYRGEKSEVTWVNRCESCKAANVHSVDEGKACPDYVPTSVHECPVRPKDITPRCSQEKNAGCKCYENGTCVYQEGLNSCVDCQEVGVKSVAIGEKCESHILDSFQPQVCLSTEIRAHCSNRVKLGCACYASRVCKEILSNYCLACHQPDLLSFNEGEKCPRGDAFTFDSILHKIMKTIEKYTRPSD